MDSFDRSVRAAVYRHLVAGRPGPLPDVLAGTLGYPIEEVAASLQRLAAEHRLVLAPGSMRVMMAHPFSGVPTDYRSRIGDRSWWANCGWDAFAILALLGDGVVHARSDEGPDRLWSVRQGVVEPGGFVHFVVPARRFWDDIDFT